MSLPIGNPPGTESPRKRSRCPFLPSTWHGFPARVFQVSLPAVHLARNSRESVPGSTSCRPPATVSLRKCSRWHLPASTWHGNPAKVCQVSFPAVHLARKPRKSVPGGISPLPTWHGITAKAFQVASPCLPLATVSLRKRVRCPFPPSTWHGIPAKVCQVSLPAVHLARYSCESVAGVIPCRPPGTVFLRKCSRCHSLPPTWHGIPVKAF